MAAQRSSPAASPLMRYLTIGGGAATILGTLIAVASFSRDYLFSDSSNTKSDFSENRAVSVEGNPQGLQIITGDHNQVGDPEAGQKLEALRGDVNQLDEQEAERAQDQKKSIDAARRDISGVSSAVEQLSADEARREAARAEEDEEAADRQYREQVRDSEEGLDFFTSGDLAAKREAIQANLAVLEQLGRNEPAAKSYLSLGAIAHQEGKQDEARQHWSRALELYQKAKIEHMVRRMRERIAGLAP